MPTPFDRECTSPDCSAVRVLLMALTCLLATPVCADLSIEEFREPPASTRPMTWMHMMDNNCSEAGLRRDLQGLAEAGVGGALIFSISRNLPDGDVPFNSPEFRRILRAGADEAKRLGLRIGLHNCDGWSSSGGPWITPDDAMQRVVWSETIVEGGQRKVVLPKPRRRHDHFKEIALVAIPASADDLHTSQLEPIITSSASAEQIARLTDEDLETVALVRPEEEATQPAWVQLDYPEAVTFRSVVIEHDERQSENARLLALEDGGAYRLVAELKPGLRPGKMIWAYEATFPPTTAKSFRVEIRRAKQLVSIDFSTYARFRNWMPLTAVARTKSIQSVVAGPEGAPWVPLVSVRILRAPERPDGTREIDLPPGVWRVFRFGHTVSGAYNHPATSSGRGLECDKLSASAFDKHYDAYVGRVAKECGDLTGEALAFSEIDSYEMGGQNWTPGFEEIFRREKGYDFLPFLPLLAGVPVSGPSDAGAVLHDFRAALADLWVKNYYGRHLQRCHQDGLRAYVEPYGNAAFNDLTIGGASDIPMGEFWVDSDNRIFTAAVSSAHTYGKPVISAEAFTSWRDLNWKVHPYLLKSAGDNAWAEGINEFMFHRYAHQANPHVAPGMTMESIGSHIDRTQTWWASAGKAWFTYLQRGSHLLRQGVPVADVLVYVGEEVPNPSPSGESIGLPQGYKLDLCDTQVLLERLRVEGGDLVLPEGTRYRVLFVKGAERLSIATVRRLGELAAAGARIVGPRPKEPIGYLERTTGRDEFDRLVAAAWGERDTVPGSGRIVDADRWPTALNNVFSPDLLIEDRPDARFMHRSVGGDDLYFIYNPSDEPQRFVCSFRVGDRPLEIWRADTAAIERPALYQQTGGRTNAALRLEPHGSALAVFRASSPRVRPYDALVGPDPNANAVYNDEGRLQVVAGLPGNYELTGHGGCVTTVTVQPIPAELAIEGPWSVRLDGVGVTGQGELESPRLKDLRDHERDDVRHFSGTATYRTTFDAPEDLANKRLIKRLDLGRVEVCAAVELNGHPLGVLWKPPFVVDVTDALRPGLNELSVAVTNQWTNRLIGDERHSRTDGYRQSAEKMPDWYRANEPAPQSERSTFTTFNFYSNDRERLPAGLLGHVRVQAAGIGELRSLTPH